MNNKLINNIVRSIILAIIVSISIYLFAGRDSLNNKNLKYDNSNVNCREANTCNKKCPLNK